MKDLKIEVVKVKERCGAKHKPGDTFFIRGSRLLFLKNQQSLVSLRLWQS